jgi:hypothetical protein
MCQLSRDFVAAVLACHLLSVLESKPFEDGTAILAASANNWKIALREGLIPVISVFLMVCFLSPCVIGKNPSDLLKDRHDAVRDCVPYTNSD